MSKGGDTTTQTTTGDLPEYVKPYAQDVLARAQGQANQPYVPYGNQRLAEFSGDTNQAFNMIRGQAAAGTPGIDAAMNTAGGIANYEANPVWAGQTSTDTFTNQPVSAGNTSTGSFDFRGIPDANLSAYMDPYTQNVLDVQRNRANRNFAEQQTGRDLNYAQAGAFGGNRRFVADSLAQRDMNEQLQAMDAAGLSAAYNNATGLFSQDQARRLDAFQSDAARRLQSDVGNVDRQLSAGMANEDRRLSAFQSDAARRLQSDTGNVDRSMQAGLANEENRRLGRALGLDAAVQQGNLAGKQQDMRLGLAEALSGVGSKVQQRQQAGLDMAYQDFVNQRDYPAQQLSMYSQLLSGVPVTPTSTTSTTAPAPDFLSQLAGLAVGGAGIWDLFG